MILSCTHGLTQPQNWLATPDGRKGWASFFIDQGYTVYLLDKTGRGRSPWPSSANSHVNFSAEAIERRFTAPKFHNTYPQARYHTQWPGSGRIGDPIFDAFYASNMEFLDDTLTQAQSMLDAGIALLQKVGPCILLAHSQGSAIGFQWADACPALVKALIAIEPSGPPFQPGYTKLPLSYGITDLPILYDPPVNDPKVDFKTVLVPSIKPDRIGCVLQDEKIGPVRQLVNFKDIPVLVDTGQASYHAVYDHATVAFLKQAGVKVEHLLLEEVGIMGNGHMQFMELNNLEIAEALHRWIVGKVEGEG